MDALGRHVEPLPIEDLREQFREGRMRVDQGLPRIEEHRVVAHVAGELDLLRGVVVIVVLVVERQVPALAEGGAELGAEVGDVHLAVGGAHRQVRGVGGVERRVVEVDADDRRVGVRLHFEEFASLYARALRARFVCKYLV